MVSTYLVERARDGDDVAFSELVGLTGDRCYAVAYRILRDVERAEDAVQQAYLMVGATCRHYATPNASTSGCIDSS